MSKYVAFPNEIYKDGGFYDIESPLESLFALKSKVKLIDEIFSISKTYRKIPKINGNDKVFLNVVEKFANNINIDYQTCAPSYAMQIDNAIIRDNIFYINSDHGVLPLYQSLRTIDAP